MIGNATPVRHHHQHLHHLLPLLHLQNLCQPKERKLGQIQTRGGNHPEQTFPSNRLSKRLRRSFVQFYTKHIPTGRHRLHEEPVPAEILDVMTRRDDLRKRDPTAPERIRLNKDIQKRICVHKRKKWRAFVETIDQKTDLTKLWRTIKGIDAEQNARQRTKHLPSMEYRSQRPGS